MVACQRLASGQFKRRFQAVQQRRVNLLQHRRGRAFQCRRVSGVEGRALQDAHLLHAPPLPEQAFARVQCVGDALGFGKIARQHGLVGFRVVLDLHPMQKQHLAVGKHRLRNRRRALG